MFTTVVFYNPENSEIFCFSFVFLHMFFNRSSHIGEIKELTLTVIELTYTVWLPVLSSKDPEHVIKCMTLLLPKCEYHPRDQWQEEASWLASRAGQSCSFHILIQLWCPWVNVKADWRCLPERTGKLSLAQWFQNALLRKVLRQTGIAWKGWGWQVAVCSCLTVWYTMWYNHIWA